MCHSVEHLGGTLLVADISHILVLGFRKNFVHEGWLVITSHLSPREVPSILLFQIAIVVVDRAVPGASIVGKPHIIAIVDKLQGPVK